MSDGKVIKANFSAPKGLVGKVDQEIQRIRQETGYKLTRSSLIQVLFELTLEHKGFLQTAQIFDQTSFKEELEKAIKAQD